LRATDFKGSYLGGTSFINCKMECSDLRDTKESYSIKESIIDGIKTGEYKK